MAALELVVTIEVLANLLLISGVLMVAFQKRDRLFSEKGRIILKKNVRKIKIIITFLILSVFIYILGELAVLAESFHVPLPLDYDEIHEGAEAVHLFLLFWGYLMGAFLLTKAVKENGA